MMPPKKVPELGSCFFLFEPMTPEKGIVVEESRSKVIRVLNCPNRQAKQAKSSPALSAVEKGLA